MENLNLAVVALAAFAGGTLSVVLGRLAERGPWNRRKFVRGAVFALLWGFLFALSYVLRQHGAPGVLGD